MPRGIPKHKEAAVLAEQRASEATRAADALRAQLAAIEDRDERVETVEEMIEQERKILDNERINIVVEYGCLGQEPKPEKYVGRPRYIKASRHGRTRLAKRSARRDDIPPPEEKMLVYDDEVARLLHATKYDRLRRPGQEVKPVPKDEPMEEEEQKEHSRDSGCPVSPADKAAGSDKKEATSSRSSAEKENRKRRSPDLLPNNNDEANWAHSGTSHFIVKGNTPLTIIQKLLERKRLVHQDLRLELINASGKEILDEKQMGMTVAMLANERKWTRNAPLRILYTITRFTESEDLPVLDVQGRCDAQPQQHSPGVAAAGAPMQTTPSPQQLHQLQMMQHQQHMQHLQHLQRMRQQQAGQPMAIIISEDGQQHLVPMSQLMMQPQPPQQDQEGLLRMGSTPPGMQAPPLHQQQHHTTSPQFLAPPPRFMGGARSPPTQQQQQQQQMASSSSSIFPHVIVDNHIVAANVSVESVISNPASVKKRQRMAPKRTRERDELMARKGIEKGTTLVGKGAKIGLSLGKGNLPGIKSIRMPPGCNPSMLDMADLPIEAMTIDGVSHPTTFRELPALSQAVCDRLAAKQAAAAAAAPAPAAAVVAPPPPPPSSMLTPEERMAETIDTVRSKAAAMHEHLQAERRASDASDASAAGDEEADAAPVLAREECAPAEDQTPEELTPPPVLEAPDTPDSHRSLEIDEMMGTEPPLEPEPTTKTIPASYPTPPTPTDRPIEA